MSNKRNIYLALFVFLIYLVIYGSVSLRIGRNWDEVLDFDGQAYAVYAAGGRWFLAGFRYVTGSWEAPAVSAFIAGALIALLVTVQSCYAGFKRLWMKLAFAVLYLSCIQWGEMLQYSHMAEALAIGMWCASVAAWLCFKPGRKYAVGAALLLAVAIGAYQSLALYFGVAWLLLRLLKLRREQGEYSFKPWWRMASISAGGIALWYAMHRISLNFVPGETLDMVRIYQGSLTQWNEEFFSHDLKLQILCLLHYFRISLANALGVGKGIYWLFATALLPLIGIVWQAWRSSTGWRRWEQCLVALLILWVPFSLTALLLSAQEFRSALAAPLSFSGLWMVWLAGAKLERRHIPVLCLLSTALIAAAACKLYWQARDEVSLHRNTISLIATMQERGKACAQAAGFPDAQIIVLSEFDDQSTPFLGAYSYVISSVSLDWYCTAYGIQGIRHGWEKELDAHRAAYDEMPPWPHDGSVRMDQGTVIIKLEREQSPQHP